MGENGAGDVQLSNTMIAGYIADCDIDSARSIFERMQDRNTFTWVEMITGYVKHGRVDEARKLFHANAVLTGDPVVCTAMITGYAKIGDLLAARSVFDEMGRRDVAAWNAMISVYSNANMYDEGLDLFKLMISSDVEPNRTTVATIVSVCTQTGSPSLANMIQDYVDHHGSRLLNNHTVAALIDLHSKCGDLRRAKDIFDSWRDKDLICYSSMISGLGIHGRGREATRLFDEMIQSGLKPDSICFVSVLTACSHAGMVHEGRRYFESMGTEHRIPATAEHYMCLVDLMGRAGRIGEAYRLIAEEMPFELTRHAGIWGALLSACRTHSNVEVGEKAAEMLLELESENAGNYVLMSNIYAKDRRWEGVARMRAAMRRQGMRKPPGWSWVEAEGGRVRRFLTAEGCDGRLDAMLEVLGWELRDQGYTSSIEEVE
ncbi:putative pentatricopeptide repeat-containing protein At5g37570 [Asparagus officinalis]|nr:putative pentatricopeptide repeat-containing protein At5g37570 [Asparagus officinalis]